MSERTAKLLVVISAIILLLVGFGLYKVFEYYGFGESTSNKKIVNYDIKDYVETTPVVFNNYSNTSVRTNLLDLTDSIEQNQLIITGGGCLFMPHGTKPNILIDFILEIMKRRKDAKKMRKNFDKGSDGWLKWDIAQLLNKLVINSLYGCMGKFSPIYSVMSGCYCVNCR